VTENLELLMYVWFVSSPSYKHSYQNWNTPVM